MRQTFPRSVAILLSSLAGGGAERVALDLGAAFGDAGVRVDLVVAQRRGVLVSRVPPSVNLVELGTGSLLSTVGLLFRLSAQTGFSVSQAFLRQRHKKIRALPVLLKYLAESRPDVLLASTHVPNLLACWAGHLAAERPLVVLKQDNSLAGREEDSGDLLQRRVPALVRRWYPTADAVVAVSSGLGKELRDDFGVPPERVRVLHNPVDLARIAEDSGKPLDDPWFADGAPPVVVAAGRLHRQKDYPTLLKALVEARKVRDVRLAVLGEGGERPSLEALARELGLEGSVRFLGFQENPHAFMARSSVFALSSAWEGLSNVLIEALACGCRVVSTDCPHGPAEVLDGGRYGRLVPVGDAGALGRAILESLAEDGRTGAEGLRRAHDFGARKIGKRYLALFAERLQERGARDPGRRGLEGPRGAT